MPVHLRVMLTPQQITARVQQLAQQIDAHYANSSETLVVVGLLRGCIMFLADLCRAMQQPHQIDFMTISSYGNQTVSCGDVKIIKDLDNSIKGKHVLVVDDIIDTGHTLNKVLQWLTLREPHSIEFCCLMNKPSRRQVDINVRFAGFEIADHFIVGYGLDYAEQYRHLPYIAELQTNSSDS